MKPKSRGSWVSHTYSQPARRRIFKPFNRIARNSMCQKRDVKQCFFRGKFPYFCNLKNMISTHTKDFCETIGEETQKMGSKILLTFHPLGKISKGTKSDTLLP
jgi:hypothetical protein